MRRKIHVLDGIIVFLTAFLPRIWPIRYAHLVDRLPIDGADPLYHLRRIHLIARNFPEIPYRDAYLNFPNGGDIYWPPFFDLMNAVLALIVGGGVYDFHTVEMTAALAAPIVGAFTAVLFWRLMLALASKWIAFFSALFFGIMTFPQQISRFGAVDHHYMELFLLVLILHLLVGAIRQIEARKSFPMIRILFLSIAVAVALTTWTGFIVYISFIFAGLFCALAVNAPRYGDLPSIERKSLAAAVMFSWAGLLLVPVIISQTRHLGSPFSYQHLSVFHAVWLMGLGFGMILLSGYARRRRERRGMFLWAVFFAVAAGSATGIVLAYGAREALRDGLSYFLKQDAWIQTVAETQPLIPIFNMVDFEPLNYAILLSGFGFLVFIPMLVPSLGPPTYIRFMSIFFFGLAFIQFRYSHVVSLFTAILFGSFLDRLYKRYSSRENSTSVIAALAVFGIVMAAPTGLYYYQFRLNNFPNTPTPEVHEACVRLKEITPDSGCLWQPDGKPEYGVLARWDLGHYIKYYAERPTVLDNFGTYFDAGRFFRAVGIYLETDESIIYRFLAGNRIRYVVSFFSPESLENTVAIMERDINSFLIPINGGPKVRPSAEFLRTLTVRMHLFDGSYRKIGAHSVPALRNLRLIHESGPIETWAGLTYRAIKIYEVVPGALIRGRGAPSEPVTLEATVQLPGGRSFSHIQETVVDYAGNFSFRAPYPTRGSSCDVPVVLDSYRITTGGADAILVDAPESIIRSGREIRAIAN